MLGTEDTVIGEEGNAAARRYAADHGGPAALLEIVRGGHVSFTSCELYTVWKSTSGMDASSKTSNLSISVKSKSIRLIFGRIDCSRRVLEAQPKNSHRICRIRAH